MLKSIEKIQTEDAEKKAIRESIRENIESGFVAIEAIFIRQSEKAVYMSVTIKGVRSHKQIKVWFPKSYIYRLDENKMAVAEWLLNKKHEELQNKLTWGTFFGIVSF